MTHRQVYDQFRLIFPNQVTEETIWFQNGRNSIRLRGLVGLYPVKTDFVFTIFAKDSWRLETIDSFIKHLKEGK